MKNLPSYDQYLNENYPSPVYSFDGCQLEVGDYVTSLDGFSGIIVSKETSNGRVQFRDNKGTIHICESQEIVVDEMINEDLQWWEVTKGILAADLIKAGAALAGGGLIIAGYIFSNWRQSIVAKLSKIKSDKAYAKMRDEAENIAAKFNADAKLNSLLADLQKYPYIDGTFKKGSSYEKIKTNNNMRSKIMRDISKYVKANLTPEESQFFIEINKVLRDKPLTDDQGKKLEEEATMVGTGTLTPTSGPDQNVNTKGYANPTDSASAGSHPTYIS
jgi:hypothetical protein